MNSIKIRRFEGLAYSKFSGDTNKIHLDDMTGYNSIFGEKICHGTYVFSKIFSFLDLVKIVKKKSKFFIRVKFLHYAKYNKKIHIKKNKNIIIGIQDEKKIIEIKFFNKINKTPTDFLKKKIDKAVEFNDKSINLKDITSKIDYILGCLSKYVGTTYPGKYSILREMSIYFDKTLPPSQKKVSIKSKKINKKFPLIMNQLFSSRFYINFLTLERPFYKSEKNKLKDEYKTKIKKINYNALILGGSGALGQSTLKILEYNKKIKKIVSYNKNKLIKNKRNLKSFRFNIIKDYKKIDKIIKIYAPLRIFFMISPKIFFSKKLDTEIKKQYDLIFLRIPEKIIKRNRRRKISFFYPSSSHINLDGKAYYSIIKKRAENTLSKLCENLNIPFNSVRLPDINSKQSITLINPNPQSFIQYLNKDKKTFDKIFL